MRGQRPLSCEVKVTQQPVGHSLSQYKDETCRLNNNFLFDHDSAGTVNHRDTLNQLSKSGHKQSMPP
eukprot:scaffold90037_cov21-Tisochrysis_lutea.AAC.1